LHANHGFVIVGISHDTPAFAVDNIACWLKSLGTRRYPEIKDLLILCDTGGSNGCRCRVWKYAIQQREIKAIEKPLKNDKDPKFMRKLANGLAKLNSFNIRHPSGALFMKMKLITSVVPGVSRNLTKSQSSVASSH